MKGYLLDTHSLIWWWTDVSRLGEAARGVVEAGEASIYVSVASVWEIAIKTRSGTLAAIENFPRDYAPLMARNGFESLTIRDDHALRAGFLSGTHRDPFDRMIAAQALTEGLTVLTRDREIASFGCEVLW